MTSARHNRLFLVATGVFVVYLALAAAMAAAVPLDGESFLASFGMWLVAIPVALIAWAVLELTGTWVLSLRFWQRMSSAARVLLLVLIIVLVCIAMAIVAATPGQHVAH